MVRDSDLVRKEVTPKIEAEVGGVIKIRDVNIEIRLKNIKNWGI